MSSEKECIFKVLGEAVWTSQLIESDLKLLLLCLDPPEMDTQEAIRDRINKHAKKTLGSLIFLFKRNNQIFDINTDNIDILENCLNSRNYISHRLFEPEPPKIEISSGRRNLLKDLENNLSKMKQGHQLIRRMLEEVVCKLGGNIEDMKKDAWLSFEKDL